MSDNDEILRERIRIQAELVRRLKQFNENNDELEYEIKRLIELKARIGDTTPRPKFAVKNPKGSRDFNPQQMALRSYALEVIESIFAKNKAKTIDTPLFEFKEILTEKYGEDAKLIYDLKKCDDEILSLRYDLTVPFARYLGKNNIKEFKRYQIAPVYRRDNPSYVRGRYREFYQCDFDIAGTYEPMKPDAECIKIVYEILNALDLKPFVIKINHRSLLDGMLEVCGVPSEKFRTICSAVDKLDKSPWDVVKKEMVDEKGLTEETADKIGVYVRMNGGAQLVEDLLQNQELIKSKSAVEGLEAIKLLLSYCESQGTIGAVSFDLSLARGLDYYTGVIYEAILSGNDAGENNEMSVGSVAGGGRYDNLVGMFHPQNETVPCVGVSIGVERIFTVLEAKFTASNKKLRTTESGVYVATAQKNLLDEKMKLCRRLTEDHVKIAFSYKKNPKLLAQLQHCEDLNIPYAVIIGESEIEKGVVKLRKVATREEYEVALEQLAGELRNKLPKLSDMTEEEDSKLNEWSTLIKESHLILKDFTDDTPKGTMDFSQEQMLLRKYIIKSISLAFKKHGAETINTPVFELKDVLSDKYGEDSKLIYDLEDQGGEYLSLRYDLTVPFARYLAMNKKMNMVSCQIGKVYRKDDPSKAKGTFREFYQADFDIAGAYDSMIPEAHCIWVLIEILASLPLPQSVVKINHTALLDEILTTCGVPKPKLKTVCSCLSKLDKLRWENVKLEIKKEVDLSDEQLDKIGGYVQRYGSETLINYLSRDEALKGNSVVAAALDDLRLLLEYCKLFGNSSSVVVDLGLARNKDYYKGIIFEAALIGTDYHERNINTIGSLAGGGRYDELVGMFDTKKKSVPSVGFSVGVDRIFSILERHFAAFHQMRELEMQVNIVARHPSLNDDADRICAELLHYGLKAVQIGEGENPAIPFEVILDESFIHRGVGKLKECHTGLEFEIVRRSIVSAVRNRLPKPLDRII